MLPRGSSSQAGLTLRGAARDLLTESDGGGVVLGEATIEAGLGEGRVLHELASDPPTEADDALLGRVVGSGFRGAMDKVLPRHRELHTPLYQLFDDLPVAALIAGYADLYLRAPTEPAPPSRSAAGRVKSDICAGWASDATMMRAIAREGRIPIPVGPTAPAIERRDDPMSWHPMVALEVGGMRRRRRIDVRFEAARVCIDAMFRDTHVGQDGTETVLHEYALSAAADRGSGEMLECEAEARVLPWVECPRAAASAGRLVGQPLAGLRTFVRQRLTGISTCTHLNDLLRSLANVVPLAAQLESRIGAGT